MWVLSAACVVVLAADLHPPGFSHFSPRQEVQVPWKTSLIKRISKSYVYRKEPQNRAARWGCLCSLQKWANRMTVQHVSYYSVCEGSETASAATAPAEQSTSGHHCSEPRYDRETCVIQRCRMNPLFLCCSLCSFIGKQRRSGRSWLDPVLARLIVTEMKTHLIPSWNVYMEEIWWLSVYSLHQLSVSLSLV